MVIENILQKTGPSQQAIAELSRLYDKDENEGASFSIIPGNRTDIVVVEKNGQTQEFEVERRNRGGQ